MKHVTLLTQCVLLIAVARVYPCAQARAETWQVVICGGILQDTEVSQAQTRVISGLSHFFTDQVGMDPEAVDVVCDTHSSAFDPNATACTREGLKKKLETLALNTRPVDKFVFYFTGQANRAHSTLRLNVRGQDITHHELDTWLRVIKAKQKLIVLDCPCAGLALEDLTDPNHIVVCSARGDQSSSPRFSEHFVPALTQKKSDADPDARLSLLDAFQATCRSLDAFYLQENWYKSENALLEDDGDGVPSQQPWLFLQSGKDGARAAQFYFEITETIVPRRGQ
ncbi:MAG: hypothetical protein K9N55_02835 [Phycisphaerae bacterium]|nr:hypothetical protein [Phycisphaerae bacterium]